METSLAHDTKHRTHLHAGELLFGKGEKIISTLLGSCVSVVLFNEEKSLSGMCHFALPANPGRNPDSLDPRYGSDCFYIFEQHAQKHQCQLHEFVCHIFGGGNMLEDRLVRRASSMRSNQENSSIGERNAYYAMAMAKGFNIPVYQADVGEYVYRKVRFDTETGEVKCQFFAAEKFNKTPRSRRIDIRK